jgi:hypothetical protein
VAQVLLYVDRASHVVILLLLQVVDESKSITDIPEWFHGSRLNYAENLLRFRDDRVAIYAVSKYLGLPLLLLDYKFFDFGFVTV